MGISHISRGQRNRGKRTCCIIHSFWTGLCLDWLISAKPLVTNKEQLSTTFLTDNKSDIVLPRNLTGFSVIWGIECMIVLILSDKSLSFKIFPLTNSSFLDLDGFTVILAQDKTMAARSSRTWVYFREGDIRKTSSMNAFTESDKSDWKIEMSIPAHIPL